MEWEQGNMRSRERWREAPQGSLDSVSPIQGCVAPPRSRAAVPSTRERVGSRPPALAPRPAPAVAGRGSGRRGEERDAGASGPGTVRPSRGGAGR